MLETFSRGPRLMLPAFRIEPAILFVDESGHLQAPQGRDPVEVGTLGGLIVPDLPTDREALGALLRQIRLRMFGDATSSREIKAKKLGTQNYEMIADTIRERWVVGYPSLSYTAQDIETLRHTFRVLLENNGLGRDKLGAAKGLDIRLDFLVRQYEKNVGTFPVYVSLLFELYLQTARWFRNNNILPKLTVWLDDKIRPEDTELLGFLGRFSIYTQFLEVFRTRLGEVLGIDPSPYFSCRVGSDADIDGLVIADASAYAARKVAQGRDKRGKYKRILDRMRA